jgi:hypothetical protein
MQRLRRTASEVKPAPAQEASLRPALIQKTVESQQRKRTIMPGKLSVGLSKNVGEVNYGSRGASVSLEVELDPRAVEQPNRLRSYMRKLCELVQRGRQSAAQRLTRSKPCGESPSNRSCDPRAKVPPDAEPSWTAHSHRLDEQSSARAARAFTARERPSAVSSTAQDRPRRNSPLRGWEHPLRLPPPPQSPAQLTHDSPASLAAPDQPDDDERQLFELNSSPRVGGT